MIKGQKTWLSWAGVIIVIALASVLSGFDINTPGIRGVLMTQNPIFTHQQIARIGTPSVQATIPGGACKYYIRCAVCGDWVELKDAHQVWSTPGEGITADFELTATH